MSHALEKKLDALLGEDPQAAMARERAEFDIQAGDRSELILFGSGVLGRQTLAGLRKLGIRTLAFCDNDSQRWNTVVDGLEVFSPADAVRRFGPDAVFVVTIWPDIGGHPLETITYQLRAYGTVKVTSVAFLYWKYPEAFLPYFCLDLPHKTLEQASAARECMALWADDTSREEYVAQLRWRLWMDLKGLSPRVPWKPYLPDEMFAFCPDEVVVDCGAYDGDTLRDFINHRGDAFRHYFALEPDPVNFEKVLKFLASQKAEIIAKVTPMCLAVSSGVGEIRFDTRGTAQSSITESGGIAVPCARLDGLFPNHIPTYIKMDIEGAEEKAIRGAAQIIREESPILAICVYHRFDDLWKLPLLICSISDNYHYFLRPQADAFWDLVCYAVPKGRCLPSRIQPGGLQLP